jgi:hypothetical protein
MFVRGGAVRTAQRVREVERQRSSDQLDRVIRRRDVLQVTL